MLQSVHPRNRLGATSILGKHLIADFHGAEHLEDVEAIDRAMRAAAEAAGAIVLDAQFHDFGAGCGVTGVVLLAESHISIHTWPEHDYAAIDVFMCGDAAPERAIEHLKRFFRPADVQLKVLSRGQAGDDDA